MRKNDKDYHLDDVIGEENPGVDPEGLPIIEAEVQEDNKPAPSKKPKIVGYGVVVKYQTWLRQQSGIVQLVPAGTIYTEPWPELLEMAQADKQQKILGVFEITEETK